MVEILDVVDSGDRVVGQASRDEIHARALLHRSCHMILFNTKGQVFLQKRSLYKDNEPGLWDSSAAGHVDAGEDYLVCAVRELREELGLDVPSGDLKFCFKLPATADTGWEFASVYTLISDNELLLAPAEIDEGLWLTPAELDHWINTEPMQITLAFRRIWSQLGGEHPARN